MKITEEDHEHIMYGLYIKGNQKREIAEQKVIQIHQNQKLRELVEKRLQDCQEFAYSFPEDYNNEIKSLQKILDESKFVRINQN